MTKDIESLTGADATDFAAVIKNIVPFSKHFDIDLDNISGLTYAFLGGNLNVGYSNNFIEPPLTVDLPDDSEDIKVWLDGSGTIRASTTWPKGGGFAALRDGLVTENGEITDFGTDVRGVFFAVGVTGGKFNRDFAIVTINQATLEVTLNDGVVVSQDSGETIVAGSTLSLADDATNYIQIGWGDAVEVNAIGFTGRMPLYTIDVAAGVIGDPADKRTTYGLLARQERITTSTIAIEDSDTLQTALTAHLGLGPGAEPRNYAFRAVVHFTEVDVTAGVKVGLNGTATVGNLVANVVGYNNGIGVSLSGRISSLGGAVGDTAAFDGCVVIEGSCRCTAAGTLTLEVAGNAATGELTVMPGATLSIWKTNDA